MKNKIIPIIGLLIMAGTLQAFSPYEAYLQSGKPLQVGLLASIEPAKTGEVEACLESIAEAACQGKLAEAGISNVSAYSRIIGGDTWIVLHFNLAGELDYLEAARIFATATPETHKLTELITPPARAERLGTKWLQMEWINYIRGKDVEGSPTSRLMIVTTVLPEKEAEYRTLHQTVWPGVVDQVARSNSRDLCIFMADIGDVIVEFLHVEYVGQDQPEDDRMSQSDVINHRWWKLTDACQKGLPGVEGNWTLMKPIGRGDE